MNELEQVERKHFMFDLKKLVQSSVLMLRDSSSAFILRQTKIDALQRYHIW